MTYASLDMVARRFQDPNRTESLAELVAMLSPEDKVTLMGDTLNEESLLYDWSFWGRKKQIIPDDPYYNIHLFLTGRGFGKTRAGAEWVRKKAIEHPGCRIGLLGRTAAEVRDIVVNGESGILGVPQPEDQRPTFKPSEAALYWPNGSYAKLFSSEKPDAVRGTQFHYFWADELAAYTPYTGPDGLTAFDNARLATRLGEKPMIIITTTPKKVKSVRALLEEAKEKGTVRVVRGSTNENKSNLSAVYLDIMYGQFEGTSVASQELDGEMLDESPEGALWDDGTIPYINMESEDGMRLPLRIVAVDPTVAADPGDECGIIVAGATNQRLAHKRHAYILEDASLKASPEVWAQKVVEVATKWAAHAVVVEKNQGHDLLRSVIHNIDPTIKVIGVNAGKSKKLRAEPVSQVYEQGRVHHILPGFPLLEDQMKTWEPETAKNSPDRLDAMVHAVTSLLIKPPDGLIRAKVRTRSASNRRLPTGIGNGVGRMMGGTNAR